MPVEIRQLVVKANVKDQAGEKPASKSNSNNSKKKIKGYLRILRKGGTYKRGSKESYGTN